MKVLCDIFNIRIATQGSIPRTKIMDDGTSLIKPIRGKTDEECLADRMKVILCCNLNNNAQMDPNK